MVDQYQLNITIEVAHRLEFTIRNPNGGVHTKDEVHTTFDKCVSIELSTLFRTLARLPSQDCSTGIQNTPYSHKECLAIHSTCSRIRQVDLHLQ
jgi:hypothetical protein